MRRSGILVVVLTGFFVGAGAFAYRQTIPAGVVGTSVASSTTSTPATTAAPTRTTLAPSSTTAPAPIFTTTTAPPRGWLVIHGTGDVNLDTSALPSLVHNGPDWAWSGLEGLFLEDDLTVVNLECNPSELGDPQPKAFTFRCALDALPIMAMSGVEVANQANNHSMDFGPEAMVDGLRNLGKARIASVGAGVNAGEAYAPALFHINGWRIAVLGFGGVLPNSGWLAGDDHPGIASGDDADLMAQAVAAAKEVADIVIVTVHWGYELETTPRADDIERAEAMIAAGADAIFGHHPHRMQPFDLIAGRPVAWSLGNFVWQTNSVAGATSGVARVVVSPDGEITGCLLPAFIESSGHPVLTGERACAAPARVNE